MLPQGIFQDAGKINKFYVSNFGSDRPPPKRADIILECPFNYRKCKKMIFCYQYYNLCVLNNYTFSKNFKIIFKLRGMKILTKCSKI